MICNSPELVKTAYAEKPNSKQFLPHRNSFWSWQRCFIKSQVLVIFCFKICIWCWSLLTWYWMCYHILLDPSLPAKLVIWIYNFPNISVELKSLRLNNHIHHYKYRLCIRLLSWYPTGPVSLDFHQKAQFTMATWIWCTLNLVWSLKKWKVNVEKSRLPELFHPEFTFPSLNSANQCSAVCCDLSNVKFFTNLVEKQTTNTKLCIQSDYT